MNLYSFSAITVFISLLIAPSTPATAINDLKKEDQNFSPLIF